jgi:hypothetical protein
MGKNVAKYREGVPEMLVAVIPQFTPVQIDLSAISYVRLSGEVVQSLSLPVIGDYQYGHRP